MAARKIFVSVGTHPQPFDRLLKELDAIAAKHAEIEIFAQAGNSNYAPKNFRFEKFVGEKAFDERMRWADVVVSHGGAGTIINALKAGNPLVIVPRLERFGEHTNDHQLDLARALEEKGKAISVFEIGDLEKRILDAFSFRPKIESERNVLVKRIAAFLEEGK
jgi:UDP-N-acetylglucosamine transferase subunit ALG13